MQDPNSSFLNRNTLIAMALTAAFFIMWQNYMKPPVPATVVAGGPGVAGGAAPATTIEPSVVSPAAAISNEEKTLVFEHPKFRIEFSSLGFGFKDFTLNEYSDRKDNPVKIGALTYPYAFSSALVSSDQPLNFNLEKVGDTIFKGTAQSGTYSIQKTVEIFPETYSFHMTTTVSGVDGNYKGLKVFLTENLEIVNSSFLSPSYERQDLFTYADGSNHRHVVDSSKGYNEVFSKAAIVSVSSPYFAQALFDKSATAPDVTLQTLNDSRKRIVAEVVYKAVNNPVGSVGTQTMEATGFAGPKSLTVLKAIDGEAPRIIDLGFFSSLAKPLLMIMKWFQTYVSNWGLAIIALTILVRLIVLPVNLSSYKSMKKMQQIQEPMKILRERYKSDPQRLNVEMMEMMKKEKVNPVGGCLPMLLQLPVFFALYQVFGKSIELYKAPFIFWIHDLSARDPFFVLPILMGVTLFIQQRITPTAGDPMQKKILMFMPIVFSLFMVSLPSGLTLYIFVSTLFGIVQQMAFMKDRGLSKNQVKV